MKIQDTAVLVTGANRGLGRSLVGELLRRGAKKIYATARTAKSLEEVHALDRSRIQPIVMDITDAAQVQAAAALVVNAPPKLVINNAGLLNAFGVLDTAMDAMRRDVETNYFGLLHVARSFGPLLESNGGALASVLTVASLAGMPGLGGYSASKAAAFSLTQSLRGHFRAKGVSVFAIFPGPIDTDMIKSFDLPKTKPADVAAAMLDGIEAGTEDIFPDPMSREVGATWQKDPRALERRFAS